MYLWTITLYYEPHEANVFLVQSNTSWNHETLWKKFVEKHRAELDDCGYLDDDGNVFGYITRIIESQKPVVL